MHSAIFDFILTGAVRWWREDFDPEPNYPDHALMFHVNRLKSAQSVIGDVVEDAWEFCSKAILNLMSRNFEYDSNNHIDMQIRNRWKRIDTNIQMIRYDPKDRPDIHHLDEYIKLIISQVSAKNKDHIRDGIRVVNSDEGSELPYHLEEGKGSLQGLILIGGDLLSRIDDRRVVCKLLSPPGKNQQLIQNYEMSVVWGKKEYEYVDFTYSTSTSEFFKDLADHNKDLMNQPRKQFFEGIPETIDLYANGSRLYRYRILQERQIHYKIRRFV